MFAGKKRISRVRKIIRPFHKVRQLDNFPFLSNFFFHCRSEINVERGIGSERQKKCAGRGGLNPFLFWSKKKVTCPISCCSETGKGGLWICLKPPSLFQTLAAVLTPFYLPSRHPPLSKMLDEGRGWVSWDDGKLMNPPLFCAKWHKKKSNSAKWRNYTIRFDTVFLFGVAE